MDHFVLEDPTGAEDALEALYHKSNTVVAPAAHRTVNVVEIDDMMLAALQELAVPINRSMPGKSASAPAVSSVYVNETGDFETMEAPEQEASHEEGSKAVPDWALRFFLGILLLIGASSGLYVAYRVLVA